MIFLWILSDSKSTQVSRTLLSILADLSSFDGPLSSHYFQVLHSLKQSFGVCTKNTNYNWYNRHFHVSQVFFNSLPKSRYLSFFPLSFNFTLWAAATAKSTILQVLLFFILFIYLFLFFVDYYKIGSSGRN